MRHTVAFYQSATVTALQPINPVQDQVVTSIGSTIRIPADLTLLGSVFALHNDSSFAQAQCQSPSLRVLSNFQVTPLTTGLTPVSDSPQSPAVCDLFMTPKKLQAAETFSLNYAAADGGNVASYGLVDLVDKPSTAATGDIFTIGANGAAGLTLGSWVNTGVVFDQELPAGSYDVVGFRCESPHAVAARIVFPAQIYRPGAPSLKFPVDKDYEAYRYGTLGKWGTFDINFPPTVDVLGVTDTAQRFYFDLIKSK